MEKRYSLLIIKPEEPREAVLISKYYQSTFHSKKYYSGESRLFPNDIKFIHQEKSKSSKSLTAKFHNTWSKTGKTSKIIRQMHNNRKCYPHLTIIDRINIQKSVRIEET